MRTKRRNAALCLAVGHAASGCCQATPDPTQPVTLQIAAAPPAGEDLGPGHHAVAELVTLTVPIADWLRRGDAWLDPGHSAQRVLIAANVRRTFQAPVTP